MDALKTSAEAWRVRAPARLHLGFLDPDGWLGRRYGSVGLAISAPVTEVVVRRDTALAAAGPDHERAIKIVRRLSDRLRLDGFYHVDIRAAIPSHAGLGSGTQLALAIGAAIQRLEGRQADTRALGQHVGRGARSAIGIAAFENGGFIVDGGKADDARPPPVLSRARFPDAWRILLVMDRRAQGVHGDRENAAFAALGRFPEDRATYLSHLTLMQMLPALHESDIDAFGSAITTMQSLVGQYFAPVQGGSPWSSRKVGHVVEQMRKLGAVGIGQTSWGPTGFAFVPSAPAAERLYRALVEDANAMGLDITVVSGRNQGAVLEEILCLAADTERSRE